MKVYIEPIGKLINEFSKLPGVGAKTAQRYAYKIINMTDEEAENFAEAIKSAKKNVHYCKICGNFSEGDVCDVCKTRSPSVICVVKEPKDVIAIEKLNEFNGVYHVLHGTISPLDGVGPDDIDVKGLLSRISKGGVSEVIMATNPDVEGEATAMYITGLLKPLGIKVTRLAHGIPIGTDLEYADEVSLARAFVERKVL
ncbi:MAG: recombination mediator RecR [Candidatus Borkfalkiaceae bacterium]|nr:recombination mediator RecR [Christensenellaceae bacterium]